MFWEEPGSATPSFTGVRRDGDGRALLDGSIVRRGTYKRTAALPHRRYLPPVKTQYYTAASLDGFIATEDDALDWLVPLNDLGNSKYPDIIAADGALAMGSSTYECERRRSAGGIAGTGAPWHYQQPTWVLA